MNSLKNTRRNFIGQLAGLGLFTILPGAGRVWKAERKIVTPAYFARMQDPWFVLVGDSAWYRLLAQGKFPPNLGETTRTVNW